MRIKPTDLPVLRDEAAATIRAYGVELYEAERRNGKRSTGMHQMIDNIPAQAVVNAEVDRLVAGELFFVDDDMTALAKAAAETLPDFALMPEDIPSRDGLIYFSEPICGGPERGDRSPIVAATWSIWPAGPWSEHGAVWISTYADREAILNQGHPWLNDRRDRAEYRRLYSRLALDEELMIPFTAGPIEFEHDGQEVQFDDLPVMNRLSLAVLKTAWILMMQPVAVVEAAVSTRPPAQRSKGRRHPRRVAHVRVIKLRRTSPDGQGAASREWRHRWVVRGHWRMQPFGEGRERRRPVWISPHVKGPEGAPMLGGEKVYHWKR